MGDQSAKTLQENQLNIPRILISANRDTKPISNYSKRSVFSLESKVKDDNISTIDIPNVPSIIINDDFGPMVPSSRPYSRFTIGSPEPLDNLSMDTRLSIERSRQSSITTFDDFEDINGKIKPTKSCFGWIEYLYNLFEEDSGQIVPLDNEIFDDISYEESEYRIFVFCTFLSILILPIATTLTYLFAINLPEFNGTIELPYIPKGGFPHVAMLFANGALQVYRFKTPEKLELNWDFQVQKVRENVGYLGYIDQRAINVIYPDTLNKKQNTVVISKTDHHLMPNKKVVREARFAKFAQIRVGNYLWIFGGEVIIDDEKLHNNKL